jgi:molybdopterin-guanine dinucleotide biosynthesis protein A
MEKSIAKINGLVLIGGKSKRMGIDKSLLRYYDKPHKEQTYDLLQIVLPDTTVFYAINSNQEKTQHTIVDLYPDLGPFGAILSAFENDSSCAYLVLATDLPFISKALLRELISKRDTTKIATTFQGNNKNFPEPLITIWEPKAFSVLKHAKQEKAFSLTKILKNNDIAIIKVNTNFIRNINTLSQYHEVKEILNKNL